MAPPGRKGKGGGDTPRVKTATAAEEKATKKKADVTGACRQRAVNATREVMRMICVVSTCREYEE
jgi:hypothetical protein